MGFDLSAKNKKLGAKGYFRVGLYEVILFKTAMISAGVDEKLVYKKFVSNDGWLVTSRQSREIAEKLRTWLNHKNLLVDLLEQNESARMGNRGYLELFSKLGNPGQKKFAKLLSKDKPIPVRLDRMSRKMIRNFAEFCDRSSGFWVD